MSGGSYNYFSFKIDDFISDFKTKDDPRRIAFKELMKLCSQAAYNIEWVDSGDCQRGYENEALDKVFSFMGANSDNIVKVAAFDKIQKLCINPSVKKTEPIIQKEK